MLLPLLTIYLVKPVHSALLELDIFNPRQQGLLLHYDTLQK